MTWLGLTPPSWLPDWCSAAKAAHQDSQERTFIWKTPLKVPLKIHWRSDHPLENATGEVNIHWSMPPKIR